VEQAELSEIAVGREVFGVLLGSGGGGAIAPLKIYESSFIMIL